jgi:hypothetical protein
MSQEENKTTHDIPHTYFDIGIGSISEKLMSYVKEQGISIIPFFIRHSQYDYGDIPKANKVFNDYAFENKQGTVMSSYYIYGDTKIFIITEFDPLRTRAILFDEYYK